jgi:NADH:ubiquinone oxidoreductase subunit 4 (chain M)
MVLSVSSDSARHFWSEPAHAALAATGVILSAVYMLWMYQRVIWGEITNAKNEASGRHELREKVMIVPLLILIVWMGMYSGHFLRPMDAP